MPAYSNNTCSDVLGHLHSDVSHAAAGPDDDNGGAGSDLRLAHALGRSEGDDAGRARGLQALGTGQLDDIGVGRNAEVSSATAAETRDIVAHGYLGDTAADSKHLAREVGAGNRRDCGGIRGVRCGGVDSSRRKGDHLGRRNGLRAFCSRSG